MRICVAQLCAAQGNIAKSIEDHRRLIQKAVDFNADLICFPELSLIGYQLNNARALSQHCDRALLNSFQVISDEASISICLGFPFVDEYGRLLICMAMIRKGKERIIYAKQTLHEDELPYFKEGTEQKVLHVEDQLIVPAICYESLQEAHATEASSLGATIYMASVAKGAASVKNAHGHYGTIANKYSFIVLMANCVGQCEGFEGAGQSGIWDGNGQLLSALDDQREGLLILDTNTNEIIKYCYEI